MAKQAAKGKPVKKTGKGSKEKKPKPNKTSQKQPKKPSKKDKKQFSDSSSSSSESNSKKSSIVVAGGGGAGNGQPLVLATAAKERTEIPGAIANVKHPHGYLTKLIEDERPDLLFTQKLSSLEADCMDKHLKDHAELSPGDVFTVEDKDLYYEYEIRSKYNEGRYSAIYMCFRSVFKNGKSIDDKGIYMMKTSLRRSSTRSPLLIKREIKVLNELKPKKGAKAITVNIIDSGKVCDMPYIVTTLLDRNIDKYRNDVGSLSLSTALFVGLEALTAIQELVAKRYVHRDIKPSNFAFGMKGDAMRVFLIDFGDTIKPGKTIKLGVADGLTLPYWSVDCHKRTRVNYKTDLESWYYTLIDLAQQGSLPWKENRHVDEVQKAKEQFWKGQYSTILNEPKLVSVGELIANHDGSDTKAHSKMYKMLNECLMAQLNGAKFVPDWIRKK